MKHCGLKDRPYRLIGFHSVLLSGFFFFMAQELKKNNNLELWYLIFSLDGPGRSLQVLALHRFSIFMHWHRQKNKYLSVMV